MPFVELTESERPVKKADESYSPERLREAIDRDDVLSAFIKPPDPDWAVNRRRGRREPSRLRRGLLLRKRVRPEPIVRRSERIAAKERALDPDEKQLLGLLVTLGRGAVCENVPVALLAKKMRRSTRTIQRLLSSILEKFSGLMAKTRDGFRTAYCFSREFLMAANALLRKKASSFGPASPHRREQILNPFTRSKNLTNQEKDDLGRFFRQLVDRVGPRVNFFRKPDPDPSTA